MKRFRGEKKFSLRVPTSHCHVAGDSVTRCGLLQQCSGHIWGKKIRISPALHITGEIPLAIFLIQTAFPIISQSSFSYLIFIYILLYSLSSLHRTIIISHFLTHKANNFLVPVNTHAFWVSCSTPIVHQSIILIEVDYLSLKGTQMTDVNILYF